eukprot:383712_1
MAQEGLIETAIDEQPRDALEKFLWDNEQILTEGDRNKINEQFYNKMKGEINMNDLMKSKEKEIENMLKDENMKSKYITRLLIVLRETKDSTIYKENNKTTNVVTVILSDDEHNAIENINEKNKNILKLVNDINDDIIKLYLNSKNAKNIINDNFDKIIKKVKKRNNLLNDIDKIIFN